MAELKASIQSKCRGASNPPMTDLKIVADILEMAMGKSGNVEKVKDCNWVHTIKTPKSIYDIIKQNNTKF